jgi:hypothetical protein
METGFRSARGNPLQNARHGRTLDRSIDRHPTRARGGKSGGPHSFLRSRHISAWSPAGGNVPWSSCLALPPSKRRTASGSQQPSQSDALITQR